MGTLYREPMERLAFCFDKSEDIQMRDIYICNTFTPKIKGKSQCINVILHWLWNVNEIYAHLSVRISRYCTLKCAYIKLTHSTNPSKGFDIGSEITATYIEALWQY